MSNNPHLRHSPFEYLVTPRIDDEDPYENFKSRFDRIKKLQ